MLEPLGWIYGGIVGLRNSFYERGLFKSYYLGARTISIGNITAGGTGKTPLVAHIAGQLATAGEKVCILTRGYGREAPGERVLVSDLESILANARTGGDEPVELAGKLLGKAAVIADADRIAAAAFARAEFGITTFVLDDGFQHRRAIRDLDIVCVDALDPFGNGSVLPAGRLREPLSNLKRADAIVITRTNIADDVRNLRSRISRLAPGIKIFQASTRISGLTELGAASIGAPSSEQLGTKLDAVKSHKAFAFCGIGNPKNFFTQLVSEGFSIVGTKSFSDHHFYRQTDIDTIVNAARGAEADVLLTTGKDAVKLGGLGFAIRCFVVEMEVVIDDPAGFRDLIISS